MDNTAYALLCIVAYIGWCLVHQHYRWRLTAASVGKSSLADDVPCPKPVKARGATPVAEGLRSSHLDVSKRLFHQLHNQEKFPLVGTEARKVLYSLLAATTEIARRDVSQPSILSVKRFDKLSLHSFISNWDDLIQSQWESYIQKRRSGSSRELFLSKKDAKCWLQARGPVKLVDGAWLGHLRVMASPFQYQDVLRNAWQILSEELGDGDIRKNHVHVFQQLLHSVAPNYPEVDSLEFLDADEGYAEIGEWNCGLAQLIISLFTDECLPEILGFNLHFELVTLETLKAAYELREIKLDPAYFMLHISIDNSESGHTAIALQAVCQYMDIVLKTEDDVVAGEIWKRVQAGFCLSQFVGSVSGEQVYASPRLQVSTPISREDVLKERVAAIIQRKGAVSSKLHCSSRAIIQGRRVQEWLSPAVIKSETGTEAFMAALCNSKPWIYKGDSRRSQLVQEISWGGRMFGSFTDQECETIKRWVDAMPSDSQLAQGTPSTRMPTTNKLQNARLNTHMWKLHEGVTVRVHSGRLLGLWFAATSLLEGFVAIPAKVANSFGCEIILALRAQLGLQEVDGVSGKDEMERTTSMSLTSIGLHLLERLGFHDLAAEAHSAEEIFNSLPNVSEFSVEMVELSKSPWKNSGILVGMAKAFAELHTIVAQTDYLDPDVGLKLSEISARENRHLKVAVSCLARESETERAESERGYSMAKEQINHLFIDDRDDYL